jgi:type I restriction enzyme S subunit
MDTASPSEKSHPPIGWRLVRLRDVVGPTRPRIAADAKSDLPFVGMDGIESNGRKITPTTRFADMRSAASAFKKRDVLYGRLRSYLNKVAVAEFDGAASAEFIVFTESDQIDPYFLALLMHSRKFVEFASSLGTGDRPRVDVDQIGAFEFFLPPTDLQRRIVARIEELFGEIEAGEQELAAAKADLQRYRRAVLKAAVTGELTRDWREQHPPNETGADLLARILQERRVRWEEAERAKLTAKGQTPKSDGWKSRYPEPVAPKTDELPELPEGWAWITIEQVCTGARAIAYGVLQPGDHLPGGVTLIRVSDVADGKVDRSALKQIAPAIAKQFPRTKLLGREVLLTVVGTIGRTAIVPTELAGANVARAVAMLPVIDTVSEEWVELALRTTESRRALTAAAHEVARKTLNLEDVRRYAIPMPPEHERKEALSLALDALSKIDDAQDVIADAERDATRLRQSVLSAAFSGKLVSEVAPGGAKTKRRHVA